MTPMNVQLPGRLIEVRVAGVRGGAAPDSGPARAAQDPEGQAAGAGVSELLQAEREALLRAAGALQEAAGQLRLLQAQFRQEAEQQVLDLAIDVARKVLMQEIQAGRYEIEPIVREALHRVPVGRPVAVHLNPDDLSRCPMAADGAEPSQAGVTFVADASVAPGQCRLESDQGVVGASVEAHLAEVSEALRSAE